MLWDQGEIMRNKLKSSAPPSARPSEAAFPAPALKMSPPPTPSVAVSGDKSKPLPSEQLKSPSVAPVAVGSVSVETQTEVSFRVPLITMQNSGSGSPKTSHARRTARVPTSLSSDSKELCRSVNVQTGRVEFGQYDEIMVIRRQPMSTLKRNFVMVQPLDGASNEGYGSDDEALSTVKRRIRDPESHDTKKDLGSRMHNVHYDMPEIESQFPMDSRAEDPSSSKKSKEDSSEKKMTKDELMSIKNNLITYWRQVHAHRYSSIFAHPVSEKDAPGYSKIVKKPMDLWTLKRAIESNEVSTVSTMRHRLMLMYSNAVMFNSTGHDVNTSAIDMANDTIEVFKRLEDTKNKSFHTLSRRSAKLNAEDLLVEAIREAGTQQKVDPTPLPTSTESDSQVTSKTKREEELKDKSMKVDKVKLADKQKRNMIPFTIPSVVRVNEQRLQLRRILYHATLFGQCLDKSNITPEEVANDIAVDPRDVDRYTSCNLRPEKAVLLIPKITEWLSTRCALMVDLNILSNEELGIELREIRTDLVDHYYRLFKQVRAQFYRDYTIDFEAGRIIGPDQKVVARLLKLTRAIQLELKIESKSEISCIQLPTTSHLPLTSEPSRDPIRITRIPRQVPLPYSILPTTSKSMSSTSTK